DCRDCSHFAAWGIAINNSGQIVGNYGHTWDVPRATVPTRLSTIPRPDTPPRGCDNSAARAAAARRMACSASGRSKRSARALIVCDFKEMDRLPIASGFSAIQNNSDLSQGLSPRLAAQSATRAVGILVPL